MGLSGLQLILEYQQDLIINQIYVRITKRLVTVDTVIHVNLCMTGVIINLGGSWKRKEAEKTRRIKLAAGEDLDEEGTEMTDEDDDHSLPFACFMCRKPFVDPVMTKCKHYFCKHCALKHHAENKKCFRV